MREKLILALDLPSASACFAFLDSFEVLPKERRPRWVKVGLELFLAEGPSIVERLRSNGLEVFLDLKLHDIPNTVAGAIRSVVPLGPALLTVHASGGAAMLRAGAQAAEGSATKLLAVTVLTSMDAGSLAATGIAGSLEEQVERLAALAWANGIPGMICSPREAGRLRAKLLGAHLVTPGIRSAGAAAWDQQRTASAAEALRAGASQLVIGRSVTAAADPVAAYLAILMEVEKPGG